MKKILISIAILTMSAVASATSVDHTPVVATVSGLEAGIKKIALLADGRLQIVPQAGQVKTIQISKAAQNKLMMTATELSFAEVKTDIHMFVCERMPIPNLSNLSVGNFNEQSGKFEGNQTRLILSAQGCEYSKVVYPTETWVAEKAAQFRSSLVILALNSLK